MALPLASLANRYPLPYVQTPTAPPQKDVVGEADKKSLSAYEPLDTMDETDAYRLKCNHEHWRSSSQKIAISKKIEAIAIAVIGALAGAAAIAASVIFLPVTVSVSSIAAISLICSGLFTLAFPPAVLLYRHVKAKSELSNEATAKRISEELKTVKLADVPAWLKRNKITLDCLEDNGLITMMTRAQILHHLGQYKDVKNAMGTLNISRELQEMEDSWRKFILNQLVRELPF